MLSLIFLSLIAIIYAFPTQYYGADISQAASATQFHCLLKHNISFTIIRAFRSSGTIDPNVVATLRAADAAHMPTNVYMFPCATCTASPLAQVNALLRNLQQYVNSTTRVWLDIEGAQYWSSDKTKNYNFFLGLVASLDAAGVPKGMYCSANQWNAIMGAGRVYPNAGNVPLWYPHYNHLPSFDGFVPFGGWIAPQIKQFTPDDNKCGVGIDLNWKPTPFAP